jgi:two-component system, OmpR family, phosphate regulon sensor histidine kinase PhoR
MLMPEETALNNLTQQEIINLEHEQLRALINSMADGVIATDDEGKIMLYNGAALNILDSNVELYGTYIGNFLKLLDENEQPIDSTRLVTGTKTQSISRDFRLRYHDNSMINIYLSIAPVRRGFGSVKKGGFVILIRDITHEKSLEDERNEFISVVSHELRTPVTIAEGNLSNASMMLDRGSDAKSIENIVQQAHDQILFLSSLINDLSTLSRAENGTLDVNYVSINVHQLITNLAENYMPTVEKKNLSLHTEIDPSLELLHSSSLYVREILQNFITNAIKYTEHGSITIGAKPAQNGVIFTVSDTGIGISKTDQEQVFNKFFRSEDFRTRKSSGTGLGLYVTKKLARLINAEITLESTLDHGSTFSIYIPNMVAGAKPSMQFTGAAAAAV